MRFAGSAPSFAVEHTTPAHCRSPSTLSVGDRHGGQPRGSLFQRRAIPSRSEVETAAVLSRRAPSGRAQRGGTDIASEEQDPAIASEEQDPATTPFARAVTQLISVTRNPGREWFGSDDYRLVLAALARFAQGFGLSAHDAEEVAAETLADTVLRSADAAAPPIRQPVGYLFRTTRNRVFDRHRRSRVRNEIEFDQETEPYGQRYYSDEDDAIARLLDGNASAGRIEDALRAAKAADDALVGRVVYAWLKLAETRVGPPTSRDVGELVGVSHTSVNQALRRFRSYFP